MRQSRPSAPDRFGRIKAHPPHSEPGQAIGLLGGSFNPPHTAHRMISETALKRLALDKVWWLVTPGNPLKRRADLAPLSERLMLARTLAANRRIEVTDFETDLPTAYTYATLAFLKSRSPLVRFVWIMGADNLAQMERWHRWREIFGLFPIAVVDRPGWRLKALSSKAARAYAGRRLPESEARMLAHTPPPAWVFLTGPLSRVSSTALRAKAKAKARRRNEVVAKRAQAPAALPWRKPNAGQLAPEPEDVRQPGRVPEAQSAQGS
jgi:nicotinate-nucleotide adenylyltransferase